MNNSKYHVVLTQIFQRGLGSFYEKYEQNIRSENNMKNNGFSRMINIR